MKRQAASRSAHYSGVPLRTLHSKSIYDALDKRVQYAKEFRCDLRQQPVVKRRKVDRTKKDVKHGKFASDSDSDSDSDQEMQEQANNEEEEYEDIVEYPIDFNTLPDESFRLFPSMEDRYLHPTYTINESFMTPDEVLTTASYFDSAGPTVKPPVPVLSREEVSRLTGANLPDSELLDVLHYYFSDRIARSNLARSGYMPHNSSRDEIQTLSSFAERKRKLQKQREQQKEISKEIETYKRSNIHKPVSTAAARFVNNLSTKRKKVGDDVESEEEEEEEEEEDASEEDDMENLKRSKLKQNNEESDRSNGSESPINFDTESEDSPDGVADTQLSSEDEDTADIANTLQELNSDDNDYDNEEDDDDEESEFVRKRLKERDMKEAHKPYVPYQRFAQRYYNFLDETALIAMGVYIEQLIEEEVEKDPALFQHYMELDSDCEEGSADEEDQEEAKAAKKEKGNETERSDSDNSDESE